MKKKIIIVIVAIALIAVVFYVVKHKQKASNNTLVDIDGNEIQLTDSPYSGGEQFGRQVLVNGNPNGGLTSIQLRPDGYIEGVNGTGQHFVWKKTGWASI